jgi:predicted RNA-binding protein with TRAM domain
MPFLSGRAQASRGYFGGGSAPLAPLSLSSAEGNQTLQISFTPGFDGGLEISNYEYRISTNGITYSSWTAFSPATTSSPVIINGLTNGVTYYVQIRAVNSLGKGVASDVLSTNTSPYTYAGAPTITSTVASNSEVTVYWSAPTSTGGRPITEYFVDYSSDSGSTWSTPDSAGNALSKLVTALTNGTSYIFRVYAYNLAGLGPASAVSSPTTPFTIPSAPTSLVSTEGDTSLSIAFTAGFNGGSAITNYKYSTSTNGTTYTAFTALSPADATTPITIPSLTNGTDYYVKIKAVNAAGDGSESAVVSTNTNPYGVPGVPTINSLTPANGQVTVGWTAADGNGRAVSKYWVQYTSNNGTTWSSAIDAGNNLSKAVTGLSNGTEYKFRVYAENARGAGNVSATSGGSIPRTVPDQVSTPSSSSGDKSFSISWSAPGNGGSGITGYKVQLSSDGGATWGGAEDVGAVGSKTWSSLANGTSYAGRVLAYNVAGDGSYSAGSTARTPTFAAPSVTYMQIVPGYPNGADSNTWQKRPIRVHFTPTACLDYSRTEITMNHESQWIFGQTQTHYGTNATTVDFYVYGTLYGDANISYDQNVSVYVTTYNTSGHAVSSTTHSYNTSTGAYGGGWPGVGPIPWSTDYSSSWITNTKTVTGGSMARTYYDWSGATNDSVRGATVYAKISSTSSSTVSTSRNPSLWLSADASTGSGGGSINLYDLSNLRAVGNAWKNQLWNHTNLNTSFNYTSATSQRYSIAGGGTLTGTWSSAEQIQVYLDITYVWRSYFNI